MIIETSRSLISAATSRYLLDDVSIEHTRVRGWHQRRESDLTSVEAAIDPLLGG